VEGVLVAERSFKPRWSKNYMPAVAGAWGGVRIEVKIEGIFSPFAEKGHYFSTRG